MADNIEQVITNAADKLIKAVEAYGPKATDLVLETGRIAAIQEIVSGVAFLIGFLILCRISAGCSRKIVKLPNYDDEKIVWGFAVAVSLASAAICLGAGMVKLVNVGAWVGMWHPEIYLAAKLLNL